MNASDFRKNTKSEYLSIQNQCMKEIQNANRLSKTWVVIQIPAFILGAPFYDNKQCLAAVTTMLKDGQFAFKVMPELKPPHVSIFVSWAVSKRPAKETPLMTQEPMKNTKRVMFENRVLTDLDITYNAMHNSGKLGHLKSFKK